MKQLQPTVVSQGKNVHFGEACESGYSTTTSSEEGTLQRKTSQAYKANAEVERKTSVGNMVSKGAADDVRSKKVAGKHHKKRAKSSYFARGSSSSPSPSPYSSTSSLTQQNGEVISGAYLINANDAKSRQVQPFKTQRLSTSSNDGRGLRHNPNLSSSHESLSQQSSFDELTSSMEDLDVKGSPLRQYHAINQNDDVIKTEALKKFRQSLDEVKSFQNGQNFYPQSDELNSSYYENYYSVRDQTDPYYDPLDISDPEYGQIKKQVFVTTSPSISSGDVSPLKPSPVRGILKHPKPSNQNVNISTSSSPTSRNVHQCDLRYTRSEENLSRRQITPPGMTTSAMPLPARGHKSAFVVVKPRVVNRPAFQDGPLVAMQSAGNDITPRTGYEPHDHPGYATQHCCRGIHSQSVQMQVTPRNSEIGNDPRLVQYQPMQLQSACGTHGHVSNGNNDVNGSSNTESRSVVYIPAQVIEKGVARPTARIGGVAARQTQHNIEQPCHGKDCRHVNGDDVGNDNDDIKKPKSPLPPAETLSNEAVRLKRLLHESDPTELKKRLESLLKSKDPGSIHAMSKLFPSSEFTADAAHCVRCHKDFNPRDPGRCILPHPERMVAKISQDEIGADFVCGCCNAGFRLIKMDFYEESTNALLTGHCYSGMHTTDPDSVDYRIDGGAAKSCEEFGCVEFYV